MESLKEKKISKLLDLWIRPTRNFETLIAIEESPVTLLFTIRVFHILGVLRLLDKRPLRDSIAVFLPTDLFLLTGLLWFALPLVRPLATLTNDRPRMHLSRYEVFRVN